MTIIIPTLEYQIRVCIKYSSKSSKLGRIAQREKIQV